jgi:DNA gyrase/topoisomerase IV subunit A
MRKNQKEGEKFLYMITKQGVAKKVDATAFHDVRRSGLIAIKLAKGRRAYCRAAGREGR